MRNYQTYSATVSVKKLSVTVHSDAQLGSLHLLHEEEKKQKGHRKMVDAADGLLKMRADVTVTEADAKKAKNLVIRRDFAKRRAEREGFILQFCLIGGYREPG